MKKSAWFCCACLLLAGCISYQNLEQGDPTFAIITVIVCALWFAGWLGVRYLRNINIDIIGEDLPTERERGRYVDNRDVGKVKSVSVSDEPVGKAPVKQLRKTKKTQLTGDANVAPARQDEVAQTLAALERASFTNNARLVRIDMAEGRYLEVFLNGRTGGVVTIKITGHNFSGGQFHARVFNRLKKINGVEWQGPYSAGKADVPPLELTGTTSSFALKRVLPVLARVW
jgi:hypothetical protein